MARCGLGGPAGAFGCRGESIEAPGPGQALFYHMTLPWKLKGKGAYPGLSVRASSFVLPEGGICTPSYGPLPTTRT